MNIDGDAIREIIKLAKDSIRQEFIKIPGDKSDTAYWRDSPGSLKEMTPNAAYVKHVFLTPSELRRFIASLSDVTDQAVTFVSEQRIMFAWQRTDGRDHAICQLNTSPLYSLLCECENRSFTQREFIRALRVDFVNGMEQQPELLLAVRNLKLSTSSNADSNVGHGDESIGKSIRRSVAGAQDIPETVIVGASVFDEFIYPQSVPCAVEINVEEATISLVPIGNALKQAMDKTIAEIVAFMTVDSVVPVFAGSL